MCENSASKNSIHLKQKISFINGIALIVGNIIGAGMFNNPKGFQNLFGVLSLSLIMWTVCGLIMWTYIFFRIPCYFQLETTSSEASRYLSKQFRPLVKICPLWISMLIIQPAIRATISLTFANYLVLPFLTETKFSFYSLRLLAGALVCIISFINIWKFQSTAKMLNISGNGQFIILFFITVSAYATLFDNSPSRTLADPWLFRSNSIEMVMYSSLFGYVGSEALGLKVEDQEPYSNFPWAISLPFCAIFYILTNVVYYLVLIPAELIASDAVAVGFANNTLGFLQWMIPIAVAISAFGELNYSYNLQPSRLDSKGEEHLLTLFNSTPTLKFLLTVVPTLIFLCAENVNLINYFSFMYWLAVGLITTRQIYLQFLRSNLPKPYIVQILLPFVFYWGCLFLVIPYFTTTKDSPVSGIIFITSILVYLMFSYRSEEQSLMYNRHFNEAINKAKMCYIFRSCDAPTTFIQSEKPDPGDVGIYSDHFQENSMIVKNGASGFDVDRDADFVPPRNPENIGRATQEIQPPLRTTLHQHVGDSSDVLKITIEEGRELTIKLSAVSNQITAS